MVIGLLRGWKVQYGRESTRGVREVFGGHHFGGACSLRSILEINEAGTLFLETHWRNLVRQLGISTSVNQLYVMSQCHKFGRHTRHP